jgi:Hemerythrin HHE cation binding domain
VKTKPHRIAPDVVDLLLDQHRLIKRAFVGALRPGPGRVGRFDHLRKLLAAHEAAEEAHVHPMLKRLAREGNQVARRRLGEEAAAKKLLKNITEHGPRAFGYTWKMLALQTAVRRHARHEEKQEFPLLRRHVSPLRRRVLGMECRVTQAMAPTRPHPLVNHQLTAKLAAPVRSPVDRARDLVH